MNQYVVSVPIRGSINLTADSIGIQLDGYLEVSVPIRGSINLTIVQILSIDLLSDTSFRPHQGINKFNYTNTITATGTSAF